MLACRIFALVACLGALVGTADAGPKAYITNYRGSTVSVVDTASNAVIATVPVDGLPVGVAVNPAGTRAYVASSLPYNNLYCRLSVIDTASNSVVAIVPFGLKAYGIAVNSAGTRVYVTDMGQNVNTVAVLDTSTNAVVANVPVGFFPIAVAVDPVTGRALVVNNSGNSVSVIDGTTNAVVNTLGVGSYPVGIAIDGAGLRAYVTNQGDNTVSVISLATLTTVATIGVGSYPIGVAVSPDGRYAYVTNQLSNSVSVIDTSSKAVVATIAVGFSPKGVSFTPDGLRAYVANYGASQVSVIDTATRTVVANVPVGNSPYALGQFIVPAAGTPPPPPSDTTPPTVSLSSPTGGTVSGTVTVSANATDNVGVTRVDFFVNGTLKASDSTSPYQYSWNTTTLANGSATLRATAYDAAGNIGQSSTVTVNVANAAPPDTTPPSVSIASPTGGNVAGTVTVSANASDNVGISRVDFYVNGALAGTDSATPYQYSWNTTALANGSATLRAVAFDAAGNSTQSATVTVNVANTVNVAPPPDAVSDVNGDGRSDIVWRNTATGAVTAWRMNGFSILSGATTIGMVASPQWVILGVGDFDGDGKADLLWQNTSTGAINVWFLDGTTFKPTSGTVTSLDLAVWQFAGIGDLNGDGRSDVVWRNKVTGDVHVWFMNGKTWMAGSGYVNTASNALQIIGVGDLDGDGKADLLWQNTQTGAISAWLLNGAVLKSTGIITTLSLTRWAFAGMGDLDGDGKADIVWRDFTNGDVHVWLMSGLGLKPGSGYVMNASLNATIAGVADYDGDGKADMLWRDTNQLISLWLMNGTAIKANGGVASVTADWRLVRP